MGFDAFLDQEFYEGSEQRNYVSDEADYEADQVVRGQEGRLRISCLSSM